MFTDTQTVVACWTAAVFIVILTWNPEQTANIKYVTWSINHLKVQLKWATGRFLKFISHTFVDSSRKRWRHGRRKSPLCLLTTKMDCSIIANANPSSSIGLLAVLLCFFLESSLLLLNHLNEVDWLWSHRWCLLTFIQVQSGRKLSKGGDYNKSKHSKSIFSPLFNPIWGIIHMFGTRPKQNGRGGRTIHSNW